MIGGLQLNQDTSGDESDDPGDSEHLALIEEILLSRDLSVPKNLIPKEIEKEIGDAIDNALNDEDDFQESIDKTVIETDADVNLSSNDSIYNSSNIIDYWRSDESSSLNAYYEKEPNAEYEGNTAYVAEETKQFNTAVKENFKARVKNEAGIEIDEDSFSADEQERAYTFKVMNPSLWKFMYEASSYLVSGKMTTY